MRCLALADALGRSGMHTEFAVSRETLSAFPALIPSGFETVTLSNWEDPMELAERWPEGVDWLIVDHYGLDRSYENACRGWATHILAMEDLRGRVHDCDLILDPTPGRTSADYQGRLPEGCILLLGPENALLRKDFSLLRLAALKRRQAFSKPNRFLISFGLADPVGASVTALEGVLRADEALRIDVVLGPGARSYERAAQLARKHQGIRLLEFVRDMAGLMAEADVALGAAGTMSWERCSLGLPSILLNLADNQLENAAALEKAGAAVNLGHASETDSEKVEGAVKTLLADASRWYEMARASADLCDGRGACRAALAVLRPTRAADGSEVRLRYADSDDMEKMFEWQRHPETRRYARKPHAPTRDEHESWFAQKIEDPDCELFVILHGERKAGVFRLDRLSGMTWEVTIVVAPDCRGYGVGGAALEFGCGCRPYDELRAEILPGNEASLKLFVNAGFKPLGGNWLSRKALRSAKN